MQFAERVRVGAVRTSEAQAEAAFCLVSAQDKVQKPLQWIWIVSVYFVDRSSRASQVAKTRTSSGAGDVCVKKTE